MTLNPIDKLKNKLAEPAYTVMTDTDVAIAFRMPGSGADILHNIDVGALERYLAAEGILLTLRDEATTGKSNNANATEVAKELIALVDSANINTFDIHHARANAGLLILKSASIISNVQYAAIVALGVARQTIWQEIGMSNGTADDVMRVRKL